MATRRSTNRDDEQPAEEIVTVEATRLSVIRNFVQNSPWVVISVMAHVAVIAALYLVYVAPKKLPPQETPVQMTLAQQPDVEEPPPPEPEIDRKAIPENEEAEVVTFDENVFVPSQEEQDLTKPRGDPTTNATSTGFTGGTSMGIGSGGHFGIGTSAFAGRLGGGGGGRPGLPTQQTEAAVLEGLRWLLRHQNEDGSWTTRGCASNCLEGGRCVSSEDDRSDKFDVGLTGLALLAFLGKGYSNESKQIIVDPIKARKHRVGDAVKKGLTWLREHQAEDGSFTESSELAMYSESIATLALCEAYALTNRGRLWEESAQKAVNFLAAAQRPNPSDANKTWGWRYMSRKYIEERRDTYASEGEFLKDLTDSDTSVTGWVVMALKSAELSGLKVPENCKEGAISFAKWIAAPGGLAGYQNPGQAGQKLIGPNDHYVYHGSSMAAVDLCVRIFLEHDTQDDFLVEAADQLIKDLPAVSDDQLSVDYYYWYYASLALNQIDGPDSPRRTNRHWNNWSGAMNKAVLALQDKTEKNCSFGGWMTRDRWSYDAGRIYSTAINILTLEVYYRYENAFGSAAREKKAPVPK